jgi:hypothetical protein
MLIFISIVSILAICGCLEGSQNSGNRVITRPLGATDSEIVKAEAKGLSDADGPKGVGLFLNKIDKDGVTLVAKADEPSDFADTIMSIILMDGNLNAQNVTPKEYTIEYGGRYFDNTGTFQITRDQITQIKQNAQNKGLLNAVITAMVNGKFGDKMQTHGKYLTDYPYTPSKDRLELYREYTSEPRWRINIY